MVERDLGSTFLLPESHLFKPAGDRVSWRILINFDELIFFFCSREVTYPTLTLCER